MLCQIERGNGKSKTSPRLLTVKDAAQYIGRSEQAVQHLIHRRELVVCERAGECISIARTWIAGSRQTKCKASRQTRTPIQSEVAIITGLHMS